MSAANPFSLENKTVLITGASSGIGRACAVECARAGASLILTGRDETRLAGTLAEAEKISSAKHFAVPADLTDDSGVEKLLAAVPTPLDGIVHSAGIPLLRPFAFSSPKNLEKLWRVNTLVPLELTRQLLKRNAVRDAASVVFVASICGASIAAVGQTAYASSKAALCGASKVMALELAQRKIRVNSICPGGIETPIHALNGLSEEQLEEDRTRYPLKRYGRPEEIAYAAIYLLSDAAAWVTGTQLVIDGGFTLS